MNDFFPETIHRTDIGLILRYLINSYKSPDSLKETYPLEIQLNLFSGNYNFILPNDKIKLEERLSGLDEWVCLSFPRLDVTPYIVKKVEIAGEVYSYVERVDD